MNICIYIYCIIWHWKNKIWYLYTVFCVQLWGTEIEKTSTLKCAILVWALIKRIEKSSTCHWINKLMLKNTSLYVNDSVVENLSVFLESFTKNIKDTIHELKTLVNSKSISCLALLTYISLRCSIILWCT